LITLAPGISSILIASGDVVHDQSADLGSSSRELLGISATRVAIRRIGIIEHNPQEVWHIRLKRQPIEPVDAPQAEE